MEESDSLQTASNQNQDTSVNRAERSENVDELCMHGLGIEFSNIDRNSFNTESPEKMAVKDPLQTIRDSTRVVEDSMQDHHEQGWRIGRARSDHAVLEPSGFRDRERGQGSLRGDDARRLCRDVERRSAIRGERSAIDAAEGQVGRGRDRRARCFDLSPRSGEGMVCAR